MEAYLKIEADGDGVRVQCRGNNLDVYGSLGAAVTAALKEIIPSLTTDDTGVKNICNAFCASLDSSLRKAFGEKYGDAPKASEEPKAPEPEHRVTAEEAMAVMDRMDIEETRRMMKMQMDRMAEMVNGLLSGKDEKSGVLSGFAAL